MNAAPTGDWGDAVERLQDEQWHILELFDTYACHQRGPDAPASEDLRLVTMICTLLRVHCELETMLLQSALTDEARLQTPLTQTNARRNEMLDALERAEALLPRDPDQVKQMAVLDKRVRAWFQAERQELFAVVRRSRMDMAALDRELAERQQALLSVGKNSSRSAAGRVAGSAFG